MKTHWLSQLRQDLDQRQQQAMLRSLKPVSIEGPFISLDDGRRLLNLASNDYLGLSQHPHLKAAAIASIQQWGVGSGASRLITGHHPAHAQLETRFARFKHAQASLLFPTGYAANLATITTLAQPGDLICADKLCHASLIDAARASGATLRIFPHLGYDKLKRLLSRTSDLARLIDTLEPTPGPGREDRPIRRFILTDSIFSMDGDAADLPALCDIAQEHEAILIVDEAHATGLLGPTGAGLCETQGVSDRVDVVISTASKALGSLGGIVTGPQALIDTLINRARPFVYTTASAASQPAAINAALDVIESEPWRRHRVLQLATRLRSSLGLSPTEAISPIVPIITGSSESALALASHLQAQGYYAPAIRPPTVPPGSSRVRISLRADMDDAMIEGLATVLQEHRTQ